MINEPIKNIYQRKKSGVILMFFEQRSFQNKATGNTILKGFVTKGNVINPSEMNYDKMLSRGWRKVNHPLIELRDTIRDDERTLRALGSESNSSLPDLLSRYAGRLDKVIPYYVTYNEEK